MRQKVSTFLEGVANDEGDVGINAETARVAIYDLL